MSVDVGIILQIVKELFFIIFRFMEQAGLSESERHEFYVKTRTEFYKIVDEPLSDIPEPEEVDP